MSLCAAWPGRAIAAQIRASCTATLNWHFFFLGAGFFLLEAQIISKMALLFGTTWLVNSIVISGLLLLIISREFASSNGAEILIICVG